MNFTAGPRAFHRREGFFLVSGWLRRPGYSHEGGRLHRFVCRVDLFLELLFRFDFAHRFFLSLDLNLSVPPLIADGWDTKNLIETLEVPVISAFCALK